MSYEGLEERLQRARRARPTSPIAASSQSAWAAPERRALPDLISMFGGQAELPASTTSQAARKPQTGGVISVGDSLNVGTSPYLKGAKSDAVVGRSSAKTVDALKRLMSDGASTVLFDAGTNDGSAAELARSLQRVRKLAGNATVVVPTVNGPDAAAKNRLIRQLGQQGAVRVVDWAGKSKGLVGSDGIHASAQGYKRRAQMIRDALEG